MATADDLWRQQSNGAQVGRCRSSGSAIGDDIEADLLALIEAVRPGAFDRADMDEDVLALSSG
jgi:hypothetical protein